MALKKQEESFKSSGEKKMLLEAVGDRYYDWKEKAVVPHPVRRRTYLWLCPAGIFGAHHFYARHYVRGFLYLALCWTGISLAMSLIDWMAAVPKEADEQGMIMV